MVILHMSAFARAIHAKAIHAMTVTDCAKAAVEKAKAAEAEALVTAALAEQLAQAAETECEQSEGAARRASQWAAAEAPVVILRMSAFASNCGPSPRRRKTGPAARLQPPSDRVLPLGCNIPTVT